MSYWRKKWKSPRQMPASWLLVALVVGVLTIGVACANQRETSGQLVPTLPKPLDTPTALQANDLSVGPLQPKNRVQTSEGGEVTIQVTWVAGRSAPNSLQFTVEMDTHSVELGGYDLSKATILRNDAGQEVRPSAWSPKGSAHHRSATLTFPVEDQGGSLVRSGVSYVEMVIFDVAGMKERVLRWDLV